MSSELLEYVSEVAEQLRAELTAIRQAAGYDAAWQQVDQSGEQSGLDEVLIFSALQTCLNRLHATGIVGPENRLPSQVLWNVVGNELAHGSLQLRAREKPRGYAGDDVLLEQVFEGYTCEHPLGKVFDKFFQSQDAPAAVRGRIERAAEVLKKSLQCVDYDTDQVIEQHAAVIGSGPALEVALALERMNQEDDYRTAWTTVTLFDLDEAALLAAQARIQDVAPDTKVHIVRENLFRLARQPRRVSQLKKSRCIICLGLMDYLRDENAAELLALCWKRLDSPGQMLVGNFSPACQARTYMEWVGNWYLTYRTADDLYTLADLAGIPQQYFTIDTDPTGVNLLLHGIKT